MDKKEFIERLINMRGCNDNPKSWERGWDDAISDVIRIAEELDEPEKVVIPQFVIKRGPEAGGVSAEELNRISSAKAHGYDSVPELAEMTDIINEPNHYKGKHGIETIDVIRNFGNEDMVAGFYWGNAIKYMTRYRSKNGLEDLKKARRNLDWLIEHTEG